MGKWTFFSYFFFLRLIIEDEAIEPSVECKINHMKKKERNIQRTQDNF